MDMRKRRFRTLTRNSPLNHETPRYSPDGRWIAYSSARARGIFRVPAIGGPPQRLSDFGVQTNITPPA